MRLLRSSATVFFWWVPERLVTPTPQVRRLLAGLWLGCFIAVLVVQSGAAWREYVFDAKTQPVFASLGLVPVRADSRGWFVRPPEKAKHGTGTGDLPRATPKRLEPAKEKTSSKPFKGRVIAVNGRPVLGASAETVADLIRSSGGGSVELTLAHMGKQKKKAASTIKIVPSAAEAQHVIAKEDRSFKIATQIIDLLLAGLLLTAAFLVRTRHFDRTINIALSFVMLFAATVGSSRFWQYFDADQGLYYCYFVWMALLLAILPAWPDGTFRPRWARLSLVGGPLLALAIFLNRKAIEQSSVMTASALALLTVPLAIASAQRFRTGSDRRERQQLKWVFVGFGFGLLFVLAGLLIPEHGGWLPMAISSAARYLTFILRRLGVLLIVLGLLFSLTRFRLNDTDAVIGRSTGYAALMTGLAVIWALGEAFTDNAVKSVAGTSNPTLALSISTIVTVAVMSPARDRMLDWTKSYFQAGLMRLQELPHRLLRWHATEPEELAAKALSVIVEGVDPASAALVWVDPEHGCQILALHNASSEDAVARMRSARSTERHGVLRYLFAAPDGGPPLVLLLGQRADGASYTREERCALADLLDPLADIEQSAFLRFGRESALTKTVDDLRAGLDQLRSRQRRGIKGGTGTAGQMAAE